MIEITLDSRQFEVGMKKAHATLRQMAVLCFVAGFIRKHKFSPTYREIGKHLKITPANARKHVLALAAKGLLSHTEGTARSIVIEGNENIPLGEPEDAVE